jgi:hypothetical protein
MVGPEKKKKTAVKQIVNARARDAEGRQRRSKRQRGLGRERGLEGQRGLDGERGMEEREG